MAAELEQIEAIARVAGQAALRFYGTALADYNAAGAPVTVADRASNDCILEGLARAFPADPILSEESADSLERLGSERLWVVDPLDGTKEFLAQNGEFAVMIGLALHGDAVLGAVYLPASDVMYAAARDSGAWVQRGPRRERLLGAKVNGKPLRMIVSRSHIDPLVERIRESLGITDVRRCGSVGVKCGLIAERESDLYVHPVPHLKEWDTCAPEIVLKEAGGAITDCTGAPLRYNKPNPIQPHGIVAGAPGALARVLGPVTRLYGAQLSDRRVPA